MSSFLIVYKDRHSYEMIKANLPSSSILIEIQNLDRFTNVLRNNNIKCVIVTFDIINKCTNTEIKHFKKCFPNLPWIVILNKQNLNEAHRCGSLGIEKVLSLDKIEDIQNTIYEIELQNQSRVTLEEININKSNPLFSSLLEKSLSLIEEGYTYFMKVGTIAELLEVSESTIIREFQRFQILSPKKILMILKVKHAIKLLASNGLIINEIAHLSGFSNEKRMSECFNRMYGMSPGKFKQKFLQGQTIINSYEQFKFDLY